MTGAGGTMTGDVVSLNTANHNLPITVGEHAQTAAGATKAGCGVEMTNPESGNTAIYLGTITCTVSGHIVRYVITQAGVDGQQAVACEVPKGRADLCDAGVFMKWFEAGGK